MITLNPIANEHKVVTPTTNQSMQITIHEQMVWNDSPNAQTQDVLIPKGVYSLEAEDGDYHYFKSSKGIEHGVYEKGKDVQIQLKPGGICIAKSTFNPKSSDGVYVTIDDNNKILVWKLGSVFMKMEGSKWSKNY